MKANRTIEYMLKLRMIIEHTMFKTFHKMFDYPDGLNHTHLTTLMILAHHGPLSMTAMSHRLNKEKGSFTTVADKLVKFGYIETIRSEKDRRSYLLHLTEKGEQLAKRFGREHGSYIDKMFESFSEDEMETFLFKVKDMAQTIVRVSEDQELIDMLNERPIVDED